MTDALAAAQSLVAVLNAPPQAHSIFIKTEVVDGEFKRKLCCSIHPKFKDKITVPETHEGIDVILVPWPKMML